jgi:hypothetical protein
VTLDNGEYWSIDIPGLTQEQARALRERLVPEFDFGVIVASPRDFMTRGFDRSTVHLLAHCLRVGLAAGDMSHADTAGHAACSRTAKEGSVKRTVDRTLISVRAGNAGRTSFRERRCGGILPRLSQSGAA